MSHASQRKHPCLPGETHADTESGGPGIQQVERAQQDQRDASVQMLALHPAATTSGALASSPTAPGTCRHFRFQLPREDADSLRDLDPQPCPICDVLPHRRAKLAPAPK